MALAHFASARSSGISHLHSYLAEHPPQALEHQEGYSLASFAATPWTPGTLVPLYFLPGLHQDLAGPNPVGFLQVPYVRGVSQ